MKCFKCKNIIKSDAIYGLHQDCFTAWFGLPASTKFRNIDPKHTSAGSRSHPIASSKIKKKDTFFHGRYLKYSASLGNVSYILKINEFDRLGYQEIADQFCKQTISKANKIILAIKDSLLTEKRKLAFIKLFGSRIEDLKNVN